MTLFKERRPLISRILFLTESREDYLADSLLHGLVTLGLDVVDYPRKDVLYKGNEVCGVSPALEVRGCGFTLYGLLNDRPVDRSYVVQRLESGWFDLVILGQVWRQWGQLLDLAHLLQNVPVVLLDGDDDVRLFHRSRTRLRRYGWQPFPIRSHRCFYLKREWQEEFTDVPWVNVSSFGFSIPQEKIRSIESSKKTQRFASHCVDPEVAAACGLQSSYAFSSEVAYYDDLAASRFAVTTKRGGWDCLRHYEIAAAGALPCFLQLDRKPFTCAPHGLHPGLNCISYQNSLDLFDQLKSLEANPTVYRQLLRASSDWIHNNTTIASAKRLLDLVCS